MAALQKTSEEPSARPSRGSQQCPDLETCVRQLFGVDTLKLRPIPKPNDHVPDLDNDYVFSKEVTLRHPGLLQAQPPRHDQAIRLNRLPPGSIGPCIAVESQQASVILIAASR